MRRKRKLVQVNCEDKDAFDDLKSHKNTSIFLIFLTIVFGFAAVYAHDGIIPYHPVTTWVFGVAAVVCLVITNIRMQDY